MEGSTSTTNNLIITTTGGAFDSKEWFRIFTQLGVALTPASSGSTLTFTGGYPKWTETKQDKIKKYAKLLAENNLKKPIYNRALHEAQKNFKPKRCIK